MPRTSHHSHHTQPLTCQISSPQLTPLMYDYVYTIGTLEQTLGNIDKKQKTIQDIDKLIQEKQNALKANPSKQEEYNEGIAIVSETIKKHEQTMSTLRATANSQALSLKNTVQDIQAIIDQHPNAIGSLFNTAKTLLAQHNSNTHDRETIATLANRQLIEQIIKGLQQATHEASQLNTTDPTAYNPEPHSRWKNWPTFGFFRSSSSESSHRTALRC